jgi:hypothetical protein
VVDGLPYITAHGKDGMVTPASLEKPPHFALALGGPLYRMLARSHLASPVPELLSLQAAIVVLVCWVPLAVLSLAQANFMGGMKLSFLRDIETHVRFLVSLPVLILAEMIVDQRIRPIMKRFVERHVVTTEELPQFYAAISAAVRIHNSVIAEISLLVFVYTVACGCGVIRLRGMSQAGMPRLKAARST